MAGYSGSSGYAEYEYLGTANGTSFAKRHPYLLWQIIGWSILLADAVFFVVAALQDMISQIRGESHPVLMALLIIALALGLLVPHSSSACAARFCPDSSPWWPWWSCR